MVNNGLKLNQEKTELVLITSHFRSRLALEFIQVGDEKIQPKSSIRNLGVTFDHCLNLTEHVKKICVSCHYHLRNIAKIRKYLLTNIGLFIKFSCDLCNTDYVGYTSRHLFQRIAEHKHSAIGKHLKEEHKLQDQFTVLKKCCTKFDCLIYEMLFIRNIKPKLNTQSDSVCAKLFT